MRFETATTYTLKIYAKNINNGNYELLQNHGPAPSMSSGFITLWSDIDDAKYLVVADNHYDLKMALVDDDITVDSDTVVVFK